MLEGLTVLEMGSSSVPAAFAGMLFADYGARVVKIEPPGGDALRATRPSGWLVWNRGKESAVLDLRIAEGQEQLRELASLSDVVLEGFGAGVADAWGIGYERLAAVNAALVYCSIKGFGSSGGYAHLPAYEGVVRAKTGHFSLGAWGVREGPTYNDAPLASVGAGHQAFAGCLAALFARESTGRGQLVEASLVQGLVPLDYFGVATAQHVQRLAAEAEASDSSDEPFDPIATVMTSSRTNFHVPTRDGRWLNLTHMLPRQAQAVSRALGIEHSIEDPRYADQPFFSRAEDAQAWEDMAWEAMRTRTYAEWEPLLLADDDIAFEMARTSEEGLDHPQIIHNGDAVSIDDPEHGAIRQVGPIAHLRDHACGPRRSAPGLGEMGPLPQAGPRSPASGATPPHPLAGVTIVELGYFYAMPYGVTLAATLGARVIKLEGLTGDPMRDSFGFPETGGAKTMEGKDSLAVDLRTPEGRKIVHELVANADVFVNGFRPGVAERLELGHEALQQRNPRLVYVHAAGYGVDGPYAHRPIYAGVASALAGALARHAGSWLDPELTRSLETSVEAQTLVLPRLRGPTDGDSNAALAVFSTLLLGIYHQRRTGRGCWMSTSMIGGNAVAYADDFNRYEGKPPLPLPDSDMYGLHALYRLYRARSGWVFVAAPRQAEWEALANGLGGRELLADQRFRTDADRRANDDALVRAIASLIASRDAQDWEDLLAPRGIAVVRAYDENHTSFTLNDPVMRETGLVVEVESPIFGPLLRAAPPLQFSETPSRTAPGCTIGQHTRELLAGIGYDDDAIDALVEGSVVRTAD